MLAVTAVIAFILLGMWQLRRHDEKVELRDEVVTGMDAPTVPIERVPEGAFSRVTVSGDYLPEYEAKLLRSRGGVSGYEVLTPLVLADGTAILTDRGWAALPVDYRQGGAAPPGRIHVEGILWPAQHRSGIPDRLDEFVPRADPAIFAAFSGLVFRDEYLFVTDQQPPFGVALKAPEVGEVSLGPHLGYAGQWFLFTLVVLVGYPALLRRRFGSASTPR